MRQQRRDRLDVTPYAHVLSACGILRVASQPPDAKSCATTPARRAAIGGATREAAIRADWAGRQGDRDARVRGQSKGLIVERGVRRTAHRLPAIRGRAP